VHYRGSPAHARIGLAFTAAFDLRRHGRPANAEPHKCAEIGWFPAAARTTPPPPGTPARVEAIKGRNPPKRPRGGP
jgi:hypothetical protein